MRIDKQALLEKYVASLPVDSQKKYGAVAEEFLGKAEALDREAVQEYVEWLRQEDFADGTIKWKFSVISRLFRVNNLDWPFRRGEAPTVFELEEFRPALDPELIKQMIDAAKAGKLSQEHAFYLAVSTLYGLRRGEMASLDAAHFDPNVTVIYIETLKHGRQRYHVIPEEVKPYIVPMAKGLRPCSVPTINRRYHEIESALGIEHIKDTGFHAIRRSLLHFLIENGTTEMSAQDFLRWKRDGSNMARRYHNVNLVGTKQAQVGMGSADRLMDEEVFRTHPFLPMWR